MGLTQKILIFTSLLVVALVATSLVFTTVQADRLAHENIERGLAETKQFWETFQADRYNKLKLGIRVLGNDPAFKSLVETRDAATIIDTLKERNEEIKADFFIVTDPAGAVEKVPFSVALEKYDKNKDGKLSKDEVPDNDLYFLRRVGVGDEVPGAHFTIISATKKPDGTLAIRVDAPIDRHHVVARCRSCAQHLFHDLFPHLHGGLMRLVGHFAPRLVQLLYPLPPGRDLFRTFGTSRVSDREVLGFSGLLLP